MLGLGGPGLDTGSSFMVVGDWVVDIRDASLLIGEGEDGYHCVLNLGLRGILVRPEQGCSGD